MAFTSEDIQLAQEVQSTYGVPASVTLAQYALESGYGSSTLAKTNNNYFGMRNGSSGWQKFNSKRDSFMAYGKLLSSGRYKTATEGVTTVTGYINAIAEIYAPSSDGNENYSGKILSIINENNLTQYDSGNYSAGNVSTDNDLSWWDSVLAAIVKALAVVVILVLAVVFFMTAFDMKIPTSTNLVKKVTE